MSAPSTLPGLIIIAGDGHRRFTSLGIGIVRFIRNAEAAPAIVNFTVLPLTFISGIWFLTDEMPDLAPTIAKFFPIRRSPTRCSTRSTRTRERRASRAPDVVSLALWSAVGIYPDGALFCDSRRASSGESTAAPLDRTRARRRGRRRARGALQVASGTVWLLFIAFPLDATSPLMSPPNSTFSRWPGAAVFVAAYLGSSPAGWPGGERRAGFAGLVRRAALGRHGPDARRPRRRLGLPCSSTARRARRWSRTRRRPAG